MSEYNIFQPLFLYLPYQAVHSGNLPDGNPLQAPRKYINRFPHIQNRQRKTHAGTCILLSDITLCTL
jgi:hypothetical protein